MQRRSAAFWPFPEAPFPEFLSNLDRVIVLEPILLTHHEAISLVFPMPDKQDARQIQGWEMHRHPGEEYWPDFLISNKVYHEHHSHVMSPNFQVHYLYMLYSKGSQATWLVSKLRRVLVISYMSQVFHYFCADIYQVLAMVVKPVRTDKVHMPIFPGRQDQKNKL